MRIDKVHIKGFRNFIDETINFAEQTLIIGPNDIGKSNLLYALRLLLDRGLSEKDLELGNGDYNIYSHSTRVEIALYLSGITEDCLKSAFKGNCMDGKTIIKYVKDKNKEYCIFCGAVENMLEQYPTRFYLRRLNLEYVNSNRDLMRYIQKSKKDLLEIAKDELDEVKNAEDDKSIRKLQKQLEKINESIDTLNYVRSSLASVNGELEHMTANDDDMTVAFSASDTSVDELLENLELTYSTVKGHMHIGGDGRNNQVYLASWIAKQKLENSQEKVTLFAIEEPEAHLHPHQQRQLSKYLASSFNEQIFITTHSPQIATEFLPNRIVSLYRNENVTKVAQGGCCSKLKMVFDDFGYRLNAISAEIFFSNGVFLVEGPSERVFYTAVADSLKVDLDKNNINIISVDGIGFKPYIKICKALNIPYVLRTDNDIKGKIKRKKEYKYYAGISRVMGIYDELIRKGRNQELYCLWKDHKGENEWEVTDLIHTEADILNKNVRKAIKEYNIYLSDVDLETDIVNTDLYGHLKAYYRTSDREAVIKAMKARKAENMVEFIQDYLNKNNTFKEIKDTGLLEPLYKILTLSKKVLYGK